VKHHVFSVRDSAVGSYMPPFCAPAVGAALRSFQDEVNRGGDSVVSRHPADYELFKLGYFDDETGSFEQEKAPVSVARAVDLVTKGL
jgi:hypothetical protein